MDKCADCDSGDLFVLEDEASAGCYIILKFPSRLFEHLNRKTEPGNVESTSIGNRTGRNRNHIPKDDAALG